MASNITKLCGTNRPGVTWTGGSLPPLSGSFIQVNPTGQTEYHVCGDLTVTGTGYLTGSAPTTDYVIVIENGKLNIANNANISTKRTAIVLTLWSLLFFAFIQLFQKIPAPVLPKDRFIERLRSHVKLGLYQLLAFGVAALGIVLVTMSLKLLLL